MLSYLQIMFYFRVIRYLIANLVMEKLTIGRDEDDCNAELLFFTIMHENLEIRVVLPPTCAG